MAIIFRYEHIPRPDGTLRKAPFIPIHVKDKIGKSLKGGVVVYFILIFACFLGICFLPFIIIFPVYDSTAGS